VAHLSSVLSSFEEYFTPDREARLASTSTGQIARRLFQLLGRRGDVRYVGENPMGGLEADLFVGHFWSFADFCRQNAFGRTIAFYPVANPVWTRDMLARLADQLSVPMPLWDLPPASFDHEETMELADLVLVVGNRCTLDTFDPRHRSKIRLANYSVDPRVLRTDPEVPRRRDFCYVATHCDLRKGFMDVLETWRHVEPGAARLHVLGHLRPPWDALLEGANNGNIVYHGWVSSATARYRELIRSCRFAHIPTYSEGQMGTLLEVVHQGCVPITTLISGVDERVLEHCLIVEPGCIEHQRSAVDELLSWSEAEYERRSGRLLEAARLHQTWDSFERTVDLAIDELS
jgi:hypothetical protein